MANAEFKWRKGAGRELLSTPQTLKVIQKYTNAVCTRANAMANSTGYKVLQYRATALNDKSTGMARGFVSTTGHSGARDNLKNNTLRKALGGGGEG